MHTDLMAAPAADTDMKAKLLAMCSGFAPQNVGL
jgi:hypothetical protein